MNHVTPAIDEFIPHMTLDHCLSPQSFFFFFDHNSIIRHNNCFHRHDASLESTAATKQREEPRGSKLKSRNGQTVIKRPE